VKPERDRGPIPRQGITKWSEPGAVAVAATVGDDAAALTTGYRAGLLTAAAVTALSMILIAGIHDTTPRDRVD
jgi:hypothetical protein